MKKTKFITCAALIAALYVVLTEVSNLAGLASGAIQIRLSEVLCVLPYFSPCAIPGLTVGCILANTLTGGAFWDIVFGSAATMIGALGTYALRKHKIPAVASPIISNMAVIPLVLIKVYGAGEAWWYLVVTVGAGEIVTCGIMGFFLLKSLEKHREIFK